ARANDHGAHGGRVSRAIRRRGNAAAFSPRPRRAAPRAPSTPAPTQPVVGLSVRAKLDAVSAALRRGGDERHDLRRADEREDGESIGLEGLAPPLLAVDQREDTNHHAAGGSHGVDRFARRPARRDRVLDDDNAIARPEWAL